METKTKYLDSLIQQIRALDSHGAWTKISDEEILDKMFLKDAEKPVPLPSDQLVRLQLQAASYCLETEKGIIPTVVCETQCDGSVKGLIISGRIVLLEKMFWNTGDFHYKDREKLIKKGDKIVEKLFGDFEKYGALATE